MQVADNVIGKVASYHTYVCIENAHTTVSAVVTAQMTIS